MRVGAEVADHEISISLWDGSRKTVLGVVRVGDRSFRFDPGRLDQGRSPGDVVLQDGDRVLSSVSGHYWRSCLTAARLRAPTAGNEAGTRSSGSRRSWRFVVAEAPGRAVHAFLGVVPVQDWRPGGHTVATYGAAMYQFDYKFIVKGDFLERTDGAPDEYHWRQGDVVEMTVDFAAATFEVFLERTRQRRACCILSITDRGELAPCFDVHDPGASYELLPLPG